ncbi:GIY-YIG nuclease family protein [Streptomyces sp. ADI96-02]|uniref:GIY-YIG nuclease family protein n=1 Tax=Streptomyces sp. ADI96-02 TaxID=1522760 RepID=UPI000F5521FB|nr:GIY-YIG nuclease family protein [Streptomyces sp. ADI96-02]
MLLLSGGRLLERALHVKFAASRVKGTEWFEITADLLRYIGDRLARPAVSVQAIASSAATNEEPDLKAKNSPRPQMNDARQALLRLIDQAQAEGQDCVSPRHLWGKHQHTLRRSRPWVSAELSRLADEGVICRTEEAGIYSFTPERTNS